MSPHGSWQDKAKTATAGSRLGAILFCALGEKLPAPCFTSKAAITSDGFLMADFIDKHGRTHMGALAGSASDLESNVRGLAEHLKLSDAERAELFATFRAWIGTDYSGGAFLAG